MTIAVEFKGYLARFNNGGKEVVVTRSLTVREVLLEFGVEVKYTGLISVNGKKASHDTRLNDGDRLLVFPFVSGG